MSNQAQQQYKDLLVEADRDSVSTNEIGKDFSEDRLTGFGNNLDQKRSKDISQVNLSPPPSQSNESMKEYKVYGERWLMLAIFCFSAILNQVAWISLQPVAPQISIAYGTSTTVVNSLSLAYQALFIVFTFPSNYVIDVKGCRNGILVGTIFTAIGMGIKVFINKGFWIVIVGQVFAAIGQPFITNAPAKVAAVWFGQNERVTAITIAVAAQAIGAGIGFVLPPIWVNDDDCDETSCTQDFNDHIQQCLTAQAIAGGVSVILVVLFFKTKPLTPPSPAANQRLDQEGQFWTSIQKLLQNKNILYLMFVFAQVQGVFNTLGTVMGEAADAFNYSPEQASLFGALFIVGGIVGSVIFGVWVETTRQYKRAVIAISFFSTLFSAANYMILPAGKSLAECVICGCLGAAMIPIMAVSFDLGVELSYPIGESYSTGLIISSGQFFGIIYTYTTSALVDKMDNQEAFKIAFIIYTVACFVATVMCFPITQELRRYNMEQLQKSSIKKVQLSQ